MEPRTPTSGVREAHASLQASRRSAGRTRRPPLHEHRCGRFHYLRKASPLFAL